MKKIVFVLHGKIKKQDRVITAIKTVFGDGIGLVFVTTQHADHATELARNAVIDGATHIICMGGDGSLNEVINGVMQAAEGNKELSGVRVGLLPYGTGNDFARTMHVDNDVALLKRWIDRDNYRVIDLGHAQYQGVNDKRVNRYYVNITDVGIGGVIAMNLSNSSKIFGPTITYQKEILMALLTYKNQPVRVRADGYSYDGSMMSLVVANGQFFGAGMGIAPHALPDDKLLSVVVIGEISMFDYLKNVGNIKKSKKIDHPEVKYLTTAEIIIESPTVRLPIDMDGEFVGYTPVTIKIVPGAIKFIAPTKT